MKVAFDLPQCNLMNNLISLGFMSRHHMQKQNKLNWILTTLGRRHIHNALFLWYLIASGLWYVEYPQNTESLWISISSERVLTSRDLSYTRQNSAQGMPQECMPPQPTQTWSKVWSQWCNIFFYLKSVLENAPLGADPQCAVTLLITHRDAQQHTNMANVKNKRITA